MTKMVQWTKESHAVPTRAVLGRAHWDLVVDIDFGALEMVFQETPLGKLLQTYHDDLYLNKDAKTPLKKYGQQVIDRVQKEVIVGKAWPDWKAIIKVGSLFFGSLVLSY